VSASVERNVGDRLGPFGNELMALLSTDVTNYAIGRVDLQIDSQRPDHLAPRLFELLEVPERHPTGEFRGHCVPDDAGRQMPRRRGLVIFISG
jgi:hypothetical protein